MLHTLESIRALLDTNDRAVMRALVVLYHRQTLGEQSSGVTIEHNGRGFNGRDAHFGTSLAQQVLSRGTLTAKQIQAGRKMVRKYARQLLEEAQSKNAA